MAHGKHASPLSLRLAVPCRTGEIKNDKVKVVVVCVEEVHSSKTSGAEEVVQVWNWRSKFKSWVDHRTLGKRTEHLPVSVFSFTKWNSFLAALL